jgi:DNA polymerase III subunit gamma/tau
MTYQSFYRRFRPQTFASMVGQEHVSDTLRNAVRTDRVAHAYLFCGPRGCGKTTSARILAKALNCTDLQDGEPCGVCDSCLQVAAGSSMDVIEMDAASNNGVDSMRDLVSRASLGTAGRRKVYILDEVHMLSTAASNTLLKTLEEPPPHVVFVLCTTDPQKVLPTIRSRTQVFEFRLFALDALTGLVRDVATKAGLDLDDATLAAVAKRGNGSARDALSALDSVAASGGIGDSFDVTELAAAVGARNVGAVLTAVDRAMERGRDPRQLVRDLIEVLREVFLAHMGLVRPGASDELVRALTPAASTRALEVLGETLVAQRDAIDPRIVLETSLVRLANPDLDTSPAALVERLDRLERVMRSGAAPAPSVAALAAPLADPPSPTPAPPSAPSLVEADPPSEGPTNAGPAASTPGAMPSLATTLPSAPASTGSRRSGVADGARAQLGGRPAPAARAVPPRPAPVAAPAPVVASPDGPLDERDEALQQLRGKARAMFSAGRFTTLSPTAVEVALPNAMHLGRCEEFVPDLASALASLRGQPVTVTLVVDPTAGAPVPDAPDANDTLTNRRFSPSGGIPAPRPEPASATAPAPQDEHEVDLSALVDAEGPGPTALDHIARTFPGAELVPDA